MVECISLVLIDGLVPGGAVLDSTVYKGMCGCICLGLGDSLALGGAVLDLTACKSDV